MAEPLVQDVTTVPSTEPFDLKSITPEERQTWRETGELPKPKEEKKSEPEETSDAEPEEEEAETESAPEADKQESKPRRSNAETRIRELLAENKRLKALSETKQETKAESSPANTQSGELKAPIAPVKPKINDYDGSEGKTFAEYEADIEKYEEAKGKYFEELVDYKAEVKLREREAKQAQDASVREIQAIVKSAKEKYPDWEEVAYPMVNGFTDPKVHPTVLDAIRKSKNQIDVLYTIGGDSEKSKHLLEIAKSDPVEAIRQIAVYEYLVAQELAKPKGEKSDEKKTPEPVTKVSKPVTEVGGRSTSTMDPALAAAQSGDVRGTFREWTRQAEEGKF